MAEEQKTSGLSAPPADLSCAAAGGESSDVSTELSLRELNMSEPEPVSREDFLRYARDIRMDPNTAHILLSLSEGNRKVTVHREFQNYPDHPDRFVMYSQVLSSEGLTGRCYWEVELNKGCDYFLGVAYKDVERDRFFGSNDKFWGLARTEDICQFWFNELPVYIPGPVSTRIGVYLDHSAGILCFYSVSNKTMRLLHKVQTSFTEPLFAGVRFQRDWVEGFAHFLKLNSANMTEEQKTSELSAPPADLSCAAAGGESSDVCTQLSLRELNISDPEPVSRQDFLRYARDIRLDPNTAEAYLVLSEGNRKVTVQRESQNYPDHPDRFVDYCQVLSSEGLTGRCYWEVELSWCDYFLAVAYKDVERDDSFGFTEKSWALCCHENLFSLWVNGSISEESSTFCPKIGVYLDHSAGILCFYRVKVQTMRLLHKVQTSFTQPLFAGVRFQEWWAGDFAHFLKLK